jgi:hypothetical protein
MDEQVKIKDLTIPEITLLVQVCHAMFSASNLSDVQATAYTNILYHKFPLLTYGRVMKTCEDAAANPPKYDFRFSPSFLATILRGHERVNQNQNFDERVATQSERYAYRQEFLKDLYADFDDFQQGIKMHRIKVWQYVAELLIRKGYAEQLPDVKQPKGTLTRLDETINIHKGFVEQLFKVLIKNNNHVSQVIFGLEN